MRTKCRLFEQFGLHADQVYNCYIGSTSEKLLQRQIWNFELKFGQFVDHEGLKTLRKKCPGGTTKFRVLKNLTKIIKFPPPLSLWSRHGIVNIFSGHHRLWWFFIGFNTVGPSPLNVYGGPNHWFQWFLKFWGQWSTMVWRLTMVCNFSARQWILGTTGSGKWTLLQKSIIKIEKGNCDH